MLPQQPYSLDFNPTEKVWRTLTCIGSGFVEADLLGFLEENFTTVGVRKAIARGHFHHSSVWTDELGDAEFQHAIAQRYCNLLNPHSSRPKLKSYQLSLVSVYNHGEQVRILM